MDNQLPTPQPATTKTTPSHTAPWIIILLILIFQPAALYFIYKEKYYHKWLAYLLWLNAALLLLNSLTQAIFVIPQMHELYKNMNQSYPTTNMTFSLIVLFAIPLFETILGIQLFRKANDPIESYKKILNLSVTILFMSIIIWVYTTISSIIMPIYALTNAV